MVEREIGDIAVELAVIEQHLTILRENYLQQREQAISELRSKYNKQKRKLERQYEEYRKQMATNVVAKIMNPGTKVISDTGNYGWSNIE